MRQSVNLTTPVRLSDRYKGSHSGRSWEKLVIIPAAHYSLAFSRAESRSDYQSSSETSFSAKDYYVTEGAA